MARTEFVGSRSRAVQACARRGTLGCRLPCHGASGCTGRRCEDFLASALQAKPPAGAHVETRVAAGRVRLIERLESSITADDDPDIRVRTELQVLVPDENFTYLEDAEHLGWVDLSLAVEFDNDFVTGYDFPLRAQLLLEAKLKASMSSKTVRGISMPQPAAYAAAWELVGAESDALIRLVGTIGVEKLWACWFRGFFENVITHRNECRVFTTLNFEWDALLLMLKDDPPATEAGKLAVTLLEQVLSPA